jgi:hypothetical protein
LISRSPSDPNRPDGPPRTRALIGGAPAHSYLVGPRRAALYRQVGASGTRYENRRRRHPTDTVTLADLDRAQQRREAPLPATVRAFASTPSPWTRPGLRPPRAPAPHPRPPPAPAPSDHGRQLCIACDARARRYNPVPLSSPSLCCLDCFSATRILST